MARKVGRPIAFAYQPPLSPPTEPYPEHAKIYPHTQENWTIREFMGFLRRRGMTTLDYDQVNSMLFAFRGVDEAAYEAESADMRVKYQWLWNKYDRGPVTVKEPEYEPDLEPAKVPAVVREQVKQDDGLSLLMARIKGAHDGSAA